MKKTKLLSILLAAPLLASCGISKLKEPKFADLGKELNFTKFSEALEKAGVPDELEFQVEKKLSSGILKHETNSYDGYELSRQDKVKESFKEKIDSKDEWKLDAKNVLLEHNASSSGASKGEEAGTKSSSSNSEKFKVSYQEETVNKKKFVVSIDHNSKEYCRYSKSELIKADLSLDGKMKEEVNDCGVYFIEKVYDAEAASLDDEEIKHYKFYQNGKVFTIVYENKGEDKSNELYNDSYNYLEKTQIDVTKGKFKAVTWIDSENVRTFKKSGSAMDYFGESRLYFKGEVVKEFAQVRDVASFEAKEITLKKVDLKSFTQTEAGGKFE